MRKELLGLDNILNVEMLQCLSLPIVLKFQAVSIFIIDAFLVI